MSDSSATIQSLERHKKFLEIELEAKRILGADETSVNETLDRILEINEMIRSLQTNEGNTTE